MDEEQIVQKFEAAGHSIVLAGMKATRPFQLGTASMGEINSKSDGTIVTSVDLKAGDAMVRVFRSLFPTLSYRREDGPSLILESDIVGFIDDLDGTRALSCGSPVSTNIVGLYHTKEKKILCCCLGQAATRWMWRTYKGAAQQSECDVDFTKVREWQDIAVNERSVDDNATILVDIDRGFTRNGKLILADGQVSELGYKLNQVGVKFYGGSNGFNQALVASGGPTAVGGITTAIGQPADVICVKLILNAGGDAIAIRILENDETSINWERLSNPEAITDYDMLIYGNSSKTTERLFETFRLVAG